MMCPVSVVVVGGAGFVGSHLVDRLLADGQAVDVIDDLSTGSLANLSAARSVGRQLKIHHSRRRPRARRAACWRCAVPTCVYHLADRDVAGSVSVDCHVGRVRPDARAAGGRPPTRHPEDRRRRFQRPRSTGARPRATCRSRNSRSNRVGCGASSPASSSTCWPRTVSVDAIEFTVLGPRHRSTAPANVPTAAWWPPFVEAAATGRPPTITGDGRQTARPRVRRRRRRCAVRAGTRGSGLVVNVGTGEQTSVRELWALVAGATAPGADQGAAAADELPRFAVSPVRARIHLGWSPWTTVADGLRQTLMTALDRPAARHATAARSRGDSGSSSSRSA